MCDIAQLNVFSFANSLKNVYIELYELFYSGVNNKWQTPYQKKC